MDPNHDPARPVVPLDSIAGGRFTWSQSRHGYLDECARKYFFQYYGWRADSEVERLRALKTIPLWTGIVVHDTAERVLKTNDTMPTPEQQEAIIRQVTHGQMPQDWHYSLAKMKAFRLFEHEYGIEVDQWRKRVLLGMVVTCLRNFFSSEIVAEMYAVGKENWLAVEGDVEYELDTPSGLVTVLGKMDAAYRRPNGKVRIVDWKTGLNTSTHGPAQVAGYSLFAFRKGWAKDPSEIETTLAYLAIPTTKEEAVDWNTLAEAKDYIGKSATKMREFLLDAEKNVAHVDSFPRIDKLWACSRCQFRAACNPPSLRP